MDIVSCLAEATGFLASLGMPIQAPPVIEPVPSITIVVENKRIALRAKYGAGVLTYTERHSDCGVIVHELTHHRQYEQGGSAQTDEEWYRREREAVKVEMAYRTRE